MEIHVLLFFLQPLTVFPACLAQLAHGKGCAVWCLSLSVYLLSLYSLLVFECYTIQISALESPESLARLVCIFKLIVYLASKGKKLCKSDLGSFLLFCC